VIEPTKVAKMASSAEGPIIHCSVREGDRVTKGQTLVMVGRKQAAVADVSAAHNELTKQENEFNSIQKLVQSGAVSGDQLDIAKADLEKAKAALTTAEIQVADYSIVAPWDGIISKVWVAEGNYVAPRTTIIELFCPQSLVLRFAVPETSSGHIQKGLRMKVSLDAFPGQAFTSKIIRVYPELDRTTRTLTVEADILDVPKLVPGMFVRIQLPMLSIPDAIVIPESSVLVNAKGDTIIFVFKDGKVHSRKVKTGIEQGHLIQIMQGVKSNEKVVVSGHEHLKNGASVRVLSSGVESGK
jgi:membrane fusion protein (multidrug efflux system)